MKKLLIIGAIILLSSIGYILLRQTTDNEELPTVPSQQPLTDGTTNSDSPLATIIAEGLDTPWGIAFLPDNNMLVTERAGRVRLIQDGVLKPEPVVTISNAREIGEGGLLGLALHPDFISNNYIYFYYTYTNSGDGTLNRVVRMRYQNGVLGNEEIIVNAIPGASNHNGGQIAFGPDNYLYITTGDAQEPSQAQNRNSLAGKILRVTDTGNPAPGNPFNTMIYSYGHRNPQGLIWDNADRLWSTEHGRSGIQSGLDELNLIAAGKNYGWPDIQGDETASGMEKPVAHSGSNTWAPGGIAFQNNTFYFSGLRGRSLYETALQGNAVSKISRHLEGEYGRIRAVVAGPDGMIYISTSNRDGRGAPAGSDDRIIRINPVKLNQ